MLKLSGLPNSKPFIFTDSDGKDHKLELTQFTVKDMKKLIDLQSVVGEKSTLTLGEKSEIIVCSKVICSVKKADTHTYFWLTITDLLDKDYPAGLLTTLYSIVEELNPSGDETVKEKKS